MSVSFNIAEGALKSLAAGARKMVEFAAVGSPHPGDKKYALSMVDAYEDAMLTVLRIGDSDYMVSKKELETAQSS